MSFNSFNNISTSVSRPWLFTEPNLLLPIALANSNVGASPNYESAKVNNAFAKVRATFFEARTVWKDELAAVQATFSRLSPPERQSLVNLLARAPGANNESLLSRWLARATTSAFGAFDGLGLKGRADLWKELVVGQGKDNLVRIFASISERKEPTTIGSEADRIQFAQAVAATGTPQQKFGFVSELRSKAFAGSKEPSSNSSGRAIAHVMARTSDKKLLSALVTTLGRQGMDAVVQASVPTRDAAANGSAAAAAGLEPVDTRLFQQLASTMAKSGSAREKAGFIAATGKVFDNLNNNAVGPNLRRNELGEVSRAVSTVIGTDTTNIVENVLLQNTVQGCSSGPAALKSYVQALLDSGKAAADIGAITLQLQRGNDLRQDPIKYLAQRESRSGEQPGHARARVLGGWLGLVGSAVQSRISKRDSNAAYSSLLFTGSIDTLKEVVGARFPAVKVAVGVATPALKTAVNLGLLNWRNEATKSDRSFAQGLIEGALPRYRTGVEATAEWTQTLKTEQARRFIGS